MPRKRNPEGIFTGHHTKEYEGRRRANDTPDRAGQKIPPVKPSTAPSGKNRDSAPKHDRDARPKTPRAPAAARKSTPRKAASVSAPRATSSPMSVPGSASRARGHSERVARAAESYANRQAYRATHGKPSVTGRAASGAAAGAAAGTAIAPGIGTAVGAGVGGIGGGLAGASAKKAYKVATRANGQARRIIVAEFALCAVIVALSPLTDEKKDEKPGHWMKRMTAVMALFFLLGLISAAGTGAARVAAGFGGIVTVALAVGERNLFTKIGEIFKSDKDSPAQGTGPNVDEIIDAIPDSATVPPGPVGPNPFL